MALYAFHFSWSHSSLILGLNVVEILTIIGTFDINAEIIRNGNWAIFHLIAWSISLYLYIIALDKLFGSQNIVWNQCAHADPNQLKVHVYSGLLERRLILLTSCYNIEIASVSKFLLHLYIPCLLFFCLLLGTNYCLCQQIPFTCTCQQVYCLGLGSVTYIFL